jgi:DNA-binding CsgD family transcriptional regulator
MIATEKDISDITTDLIKCSYYHAHRIKGFIKADLEDISQEIVARTITVIHKQPTAIQKATPETFKSHVLSLMFYITKRMVSDKCVQDTTLKHQRADAMCYSDFNVEDFTIEPCLDSMPSNTVKGEDSRSIILEYEQSKYTDVNTLNLRLEIDGIKANLTQKEAKIVELLELGYDGRVINKILGVSHNYAHFMLNNIRSRLGSLNELYNKQLTFNKIKHNMSSKRESHDSLTKFNGGCKMATTPKKAPAKKADVKKVPAKKAAAKAPIAKASKAELVANFVQPMLDKGKLSRREIADKVADKFGLTPGTAYIYVSKLAAPTKPKKAVAPAKKAPAKAPEKKAPAKKAPSKASAKKATEKKAPAKAKPKAAAPKSKAKSKKASDEDDELSDPFMDESDTDDFDPEADV